MQTKDVVIVSACRTAIGKFQGQFKDVSARELAITAGKEAIRRAGIDRYFDHLFVSSDIGAVKPHAAFFDACFAAIPDFERARTAILGDGIGGQRHPGRTPHHLVQSAARRKYHPLAARRRGVPSCRRAGSAREMGNGVKPRQGATFTPLRALKKAVSFII